MTARLVEWDLYRHSREDRSVHGSSSALDWPQADEEALSQRDSAGQVVVAPAVLDASSPSAVAHVLLPHALSSSSLLDGVDAQGSAVRASLAPSCLAHEVLDFFSPETRGHVGDKRESGVASDARESPSMGAEIEAEVGYCTGADLEVLESSRQWKDCDYLMAASDAGSEKLVVEVGVHVEAAQVRSVLKV